ncbi:MAG TPA: insulinase family protein [Vicinamibacterales bacterium]|nr:insulinase family protein [Vicinamibacterales bacterium]
MGRYARVESSTLDWRDPHRTDVDGVPVFWAEGTPQLGASLSFRIGTVDEEFTHSGITHLVEHLALHRLRAVGHPMNGMVHGTRTSFMAIGTPEELVTFFGEICRSLRSLPLERLAQEKQVLATEALRRPPNLNCLLLSLHCGRTPYGRGPSEFGLYALKAAQVQRWSDLHFTRENAVLWISGPIPHNLRLDLPSGVRRTVPTPQPIPWLQPPLYCHWTIAGVAISSLTAWSPSLSLATGVALSRLRERLRFEEGISYSVWGDPDRITPSHAHVLIGCDCANDHAERAADILLEVLEAVGSDGPTSAEVQALIEQSERFFRSPANIPTLLDRRAHAELDGVTTEPLAAFYDKLSRIEPAEIGATMRNVMDAAILVMPDGCRPARNTFDEYPRNSPTLVEGRMFRRSPKPRKGVALDRIYLSQDGITFASVDGRVQTVYFASCVALFKDLDGGRRLLLGEDGFTIEIAAAEWEDGIELGALIDLATPDERIMR